MKVLTVCGITGSGKTTVVTGIIKELRRRGYSVGSVKDIHFEGFRLETEGSNTHRHKLAGAEPVTARGHRETGIMYDCALDIDEILCHYAHDYVILEGVYEVDAPKILTAHSKQELEERFTERVFLVSGRISGEIAEFRGLPVWSPFDKMKEIVDKIESEVPEYRLKGEVKLLINGVCQPLSPAAGSELAGILSKNKITKNKIEEGKCSVELLLCGDTQK